MRANMAGTQNRRAALAVCALLAVATLLLYWPATRNGFIAIDDHDYILDNTQVTAGLTWAGIAWAFTTGHASNWHPLTWVSHMADCQFFGLNPAGHHFVNILLHTVNSLLVFLLLRRMTGSLWRSAFVAAFFAWHPLHVESVAWASERKDVLSTLFWLLTMLAYVRYVELSKVQSPKSKVLYALALVCFALGLMSKPMVVTLPFVLLLVDFWPLQRGWMDSPDGESPNLFSLPWGKLILEKLPLFVLAGVASVVTFLVQRKAGAMTSLETLPLSTRVENAAIAYFQYISKTVLPVNLAAFYPYPFNRHPPVAIFVTAFVLLGLLSCLFLLCVRRRPYLAVGWFWFLGTLVPTIGLVQVGSQSMADRYMYIPSIGLFMAAIWGLVDFLSGWQFGRKILAVAGVVALAGCIVVTSFQIGYWHDSRALWTHAIDVTTGNYVAYNGLGGVFDEEHKPAEALTNYLISVQINPRYSEGEYNLGTAYLNQGDLGDAYTELSNSIKSDPDYAPAQNNLGETLMKMGKPDEAAARYLRAIQLAPDFAEAHYNYATLLAQQGKFPDAIGQFREAIRLKPKYAEAHGNLGVALMNANQPAAGLAEFTEAARLQPDKASAHFNLALALASQHETSNAIAEYRAAMRLDNNYAAACNNLAWLLACDPHPELRDGKEAVRLAQRACELTAFKEFEPMLTLAAAFGENGQFDDATATAQKAITLAKAANNTNGVTKASALVDRLQAHQPFHETGQ